MLPLVFRFNTFLIKDDKLVIHSRMTPSYCCRPSGRWSKVKEEASHHHRSSKEMLRHWLWLSQNEQLFRGEVSSTEICGARYEPPSPRPCRELDFTFSNSHFHFVTMLSHETSSHFSATLFSSKIFVCCLGALWRRDWDTHSLLKVEKEKSEGLQLKEEREQSK